MTIRIRSAIALALACLLHLPAPAAAQPDVRGILFAVGVSDDGGALLEPVANLLAEGFMQPPDDPESDDMARFYARWMRPGTRYEVLSRGERIGTATLREVRDGGCFGMALPGTLDTGRTLNEGWQGLAGEGLPEQRDAPWLREVTAEEKRRLDRMAAALFDAHGIRVAERTRGDTATAALIGHPNARPVLVASYALKTEDALFRQAALLVIAEDGDDGYRPAYAWFHEASEADVESRELIDAADLDGDGQAELVVRNGFYESWSFTILTRSPMGWVEVYSGGGGGC
ncbi:MAG TPA: hypothetical protein VFT45_19045 [Longimicrobium sp.]|nr:hypothetical protein [Longimicrobium sp.]